MRTNIIKPTELAKVTNQHIVVVLDVFRASNTIMALLTAGAARVYVLAQAHAAFALHQAKPQAVLLGERKGVAIAGMQGGNSPAQALKMKLYGQEAILTTSAGTQAIEQLNHAHLVTYGSFANAKALTAWLQRQAKDVLFLPMGLEAKEPALEDDLAAEYLQKMLSGQTAPDFEQIKTRLHACAGAQRLRGLHQRPDLDLCCQLDIMPIIPVVDYKTRPPCVVSWPINNSDNPGRR